MLGIVLLLAVASALGGGFLGFGGKTAAQYVSEAATSFAAAPVVHEAGGFTKDAHQYQVDVTEKKSGDSQGSVVLDGQTVQYRYTGGHAFLQASQGYWSVHGIGNARLAAFLATRWVTSPTVTADFSGVGLSSSEAMVDLARTAVTSLRKGQTTRIGGVPAVELSDASGDVYVSTTPPTRFLRLVSRAGYRTADGLIGISMDLDYPASLTVQAPASPIDVSDPRMLPAQYAPVAGSFKFTNCGSPSGCTMTATVRNQRGDQVGAAQANFRLTSGAGGALGTCSAPINPVPYNQTEDVSCTVTGQAWAAFIRAGGQYQGNVTVHNSFYDG